MQNTGALPDSFPIYIVCSRQRRDPSRHDYSLSSHESVAGSPVRVFLPRVLPVSLVEISISPPDGRFIARAICHLVIAPAGWSSGTAYSEHS